VTDTEVRASTSAAKGRPSRLADEECPNDRLAQVHGHGCVLRNGVRSPCQRLTRLNTHTVDGRHVGGHHDDEAGCCRRNGRHLTTSPGDRGTSTTRALSRRPGASTARDRRCNPVISTVGTTGTGSHGTRSCLICGDRHARWLQRVGVSTGQARPLDGVRVVRSSAGPMREATCRSPQVVGRHLRAQGCRCHAPRCPTRGAGLGTGSPTCGRSALRPGSA